MPSYFKVYYPESSFLTNINFNEDTRTGFDLAVKYKKDFKDFGFQIGANLTHYTTNAAKRDDTAYSGCTNLHSHPQCKEGSLFAMPSAYFEPF